MTVRRHRLDWSFLFFLTSAVFGLGLGAGSFSAARNTVRNEKDLGTGKKWAGVFLFAALQFGMTLAGYGVARGVSSSSDLGSMILWVALLLAVYFGGRMILTGVRDLRKAEIEAMKAADKEQGSGSEEDEPEKEESPETGHFPGKQVTRVSDKIPVMWRLFIAALTAAGAALAAGFTIPDRPFEGAAVMAGIVAGSSAVFAWTAMSGVPKKNLKLTSYASILGGVLVIAAGMIGIIGRYPA